MLRSLIHANFIISKLLMDPSEEKRVMPKSAPKKRSFILPAVLLIILSCSIGGIYLFLNSSSTPPLALPEPVSEEAGSIQLATVPSSQEETKITATPEDIMEPVQDLTPEEAIVTAPALPAPDPDEVFFEETKEVVEPVTTDEIVATPQIKEIPTVCSEPAKQLDIFYSHLDKQPYIQAYQLKESSEVHFEQLIEKLLANPPKVTRESDDLYTILRNTAHFFRISGKDNILMLKGILNSEKDSLEQILANYYFLLNTPECIHNKYAKKINGDALYEYACFFLNTMGGRLYLFRRDSQSRMVVTYYAILLVDIANKQQNNRHGIALKPAINMLISEMEIGGSKMKNSEHYLDILYDLKEAYQ